MMMSEMHRFGNMSFLDLSTVSNDSAIDIHVHIEYYDFAGKHILL